MKNSSATALTDDIALLDRVRNTMGFSLPDVARRFRELEQFRDWRDVEEDEEEGSFSNLLRSLQRVAAGNTTMTAPLRLALILVERDWMRAQLHADEAEWLEGPGGMLMTNHSGFDIHLMPETRGRWHVNLRHTETKYSPSWIAWQDSLAIAKVRAFVQLDDTLLDPNWQREIPSK